MQTKVTESGVKTPKRDVRAIVYRVVAILLGLFFMVIGAPFLSWPFGGIIESAAPEMPAGFDFDPTRWYAGMFGAYFFFFMAIPLLFTAWQPRAKAGIVQYVLVMLVVVNIGSIFALEEFDLFNWILLAVVVAAFPAPHELLRFDRESIDRVLLGATVLGALALIPFVQDTLHQNTVDAGSEFQKSGTYWGALWILFGTLIAGGISSLRAHGAGALVTIVGAAFVFLGAASIAVPDHPGSWGFPFGALSIAAGGAAIAYAQAGRGRASRRS